MVEQNVSEAKKTGFYNPITTVVIVVGLYFGAQVLLAVVLSLIPILLGWNTSQMDAWVETVPAQFLTIATVEAATVWALWWFVKSRGLTWKSLGVKWPRIKDLGYAVGGYVSYMVLFVLISQIVRGLIPSIDFDQPQEIGFDKATTGNGLILVFISLVVLPPIAEELMCRGFLYTNLRANLNKVAAAILTSLLFAAAHLQWGSGNALLWVAALDTFILSLILVYLREKTDSLAASIMVHMMKNGLAFAVLFILKAA